jgi:hypothetical protein
MNLATNVVSALQLKRCDVPLELQSNFAALRHVPLFFAGYVRKLNHRFTVQDRVLIATLDHVYVCDPNGDILRCFPYSAVETIIVDPPRQQMALIVPTEYDVAFSTTDTQSLLHVIEVIRGLHHATKPLRVEVIARSDAHADAEAPEASAVSVTPTAATPAPAAAGEDGGEPSEPTRWGRLVAWVRGRRKEVSWFTGANDTNCIGRGYYTVRLKRPVDFRLRLDRRNE